MVQKERVINIKIPNELHKKLRIGAASVEKTLKEYITGVLEAHVKSQKDVAFSDTKAEEKPTESDH